MAETLSTQLLRSYSYSNNSRKSYDEGILRPSGFHKVRFLSESTASSMDSDLYIPIDPSERSIYDFLMNISGDLVKDSGKDFTGNGLTFLDGLDKKRYSDLIQTLDKLHTERLAGNIKQDAYERAQRDILNLHAKKVKWLGESSSSRTETFNSLYQKKTKVGGVPSQAFKLHSQKVSNLSRIAKTGNILLNAHSVYKLCDDISKKDDVQEKNKVLWKDGTGILFGLGAGVATNLTMGLFIASGPFGWVLGVVVTTAASYYAQEAGKRVGENVYDQYGRKIDLVSPTVIGKLCS